MRYLKSQCTPMHVLILLFVAAAQTASSSSADFISKGTHCDMRYLITGQKFFEVGSYKLALGQFKPIANRGCDEARYYLRLTYVADREGG